MLATFLRGYTQAPSQMGFIQRLCRPLFRGICAQPLCNPLSEEWFDTTIMQFPFQRCESPSHSNLCKYPSTGDSLKPSCKPISTGVCTQDYASPLPSEAAKCSPHLCRSEHFMQFLANKLILTLPQPPHPMGRWLAHMTFLYRSEHLMQFWQNYF